MNSTSAGRPAARRRDCRGLAFGLTLLLSAPAVAQLDWHRQGDWQRLSPTVEATQSSYAGMAYDSVRQRTVRFGGLDGGGNALAETWEFDGATWVQRFPASHPTARSQPAMAFDVGRHRVVLYGGQVGVGNATDTWEWDGTSWINMTQAIAPSVVMGARLVYQPTHNAVVLCGGSSTTAFEVWEWNGIGWTQQLQWSTPTPRIAPALAYDEVRDVLVMSGGITVNSIHETWEFHSSTWTLRTPAQSPSYRFGHAIAWDPNAQRLVIFGGTDYLAAKGDTWEYDGQNWVQRTPLVAPPAQAGHAMVTTPLGILLNGSHETWVYRSSPGERGDADMATELVNGQTVLFGGRLGGANLGDTWTWDNQWQRRLPTLSPSPRYAHAMGSRAGRVYLFGGTDGTTNFTDTWEWNGSNWQSLPGLNYMPSLRWPSMADDPGRARILMFGGLDGTGAPSDGLWTLENSGTANPGWVFQAPSVTRPAARSRASIAYDTVRDVLVLFGGATSVFTTLGDTWEWSPVAHAWTQRTPLHSPSPRAGAAMGYDARRRRVVLFGGSTGLLAAVNDSWEWDGSDWQQIATPSAPAPRPNTAAAQRGDQLMIFGAPAFGPPRGTTPALSDTWTYYTDRPGEYNRYGTGCHGLSLSGPLDQLPRIGAYAQGLLTGLPQSSSLAAFLLGFQLANVPLAPSGAPGCTLWVGSPDLYIAGALNGASTLTLPIPYNPAFVGYVAELQGVGIDPTANSLGYTFSNGLQIVVGWW